MAEPLVVSFKVATSADRAFDLWANRTELWWPKGHTMSGDEDVEIVFEAQPGGRIFERTAAGAEHEWGEVLTWEPPGRLRYLWHVFFDRSEATTVQVDFAPRGAAETEVTITQTGFEALGAAGEERRKRTHNAWAALTGLYREVCAA